MPPVLICFCCVCLRAAEPLPLLHVRNLSGYHCFHELSCAGRLPGCCVPLLHTCTHYPTGV